MARRAVDRRQFIGAAAGAAAAGATLGSGWTRNAQGSFQCLEQTVTGLPPWRWGWAGTTPIAAWNTEPEAQAFLTYLGGIGTRNFEAQEGDFGYWRPANFPAQPGRQNPIFNAWLAAGSAFDAAGVTVAGDTGGPDGATAESVGAAIAKANALGCNALGAVGGLPAVPGAGVPLTTLDGPDGISAWQEAAELMNTYGWRFQNGQGPAGNATFDYGDGAGAVPVAGRPCLRFYRRFGAEGGKWISNGSSAYNNHFTCEILAQELDPAYAYSQPDMGGLLRGLWMAGGGPSVGVSPFSIVDEPLAVGYNRQYDPESGGAGFIGNNVLFMPDLVERLQAHWPSIVVSDLGGGTAPGALNDQGTTGNPVGDNRNDAATERSDPAMLAFNTRWRWGRSYSDWINSVAPGNGHGRVWDQSQDTTPFQECFARLRDPSDHVYMVTCEGANAVPASRLYYKKLAEQGNAMLASIAMNRRAVQQAAPDVSDPATNSWPATQAAWADSTGSAPGGGNTAPFSPPALNTSLRSYPSDTRSRPPASIGAPIPRCSPELDGGGRVGRKLRVDLLGTWSNHDAPYDQDFCFTWLRDGEAIKMPGEQSGVLNGPPTGSPDCSSCGTATRYYLVQPEDAGHRISCAVIARNAYSSTPYLTPAVISEGCAPEATKAPHLSLRRYGNGTPRRVRATKGTWNPTGSSATYSFERSADGGATWEPVNPNFVVANNYNVPGSDVGTVPPTQVRALVTVTNPRCGTSEPTLTDNAIVLE